MMMMQVRATANRWMRTLAVTRTRQVQWLRSSFWVWSSLSSSASSPVCVLARVASCAVSTAESTTSGREWPLSRRNTSRCPPRSAPTTHAVGLLPNTPFRTRTTSGPGDIELRCRRPGQDTMTPCRRRHRDGPPRTATARSALPLSCSNRNWTICTWPGRSRPPPTW